MPRFTLRRLLLTAAILPPAFAGVWYFFDLGKFHTGSNENAVRKKLLGYTPPGTSPDKVLDFVVNKLHRSGQGDAYYKYLRSYEASTGRMDNQLTPTDAMYGDPRTISVVVSSWPAGLMLAHEVEATWHFDAQDRLVDVTTRSYGIGP
jgi:hypothetical protein